MRSAPEPCTKPARPNHSRNESDEGYQPVVVQLAPRWRVIVCRDGLQWILQQRLSATETLTRAGWRGRRYFRTRDGLIAACGRALSDIDGAALTALHALPERI
ncbi:hypothetical protein ABID20_000558 [Rhizobium alvei]